MRASCFQNNSDEDLVWEVRAGNRKAFDELAHRFRGAITQIAYETLQSRTAAEDLAQEVLVVAFGSLTHLRNPSNFAGWLYAIARYRARRIAYQEQRIVPIDPSQLSRLSGNTDSAESTFFEARQHMEIAEALIGLKPDYRTVLLLRYSEQWTIARIAAFLSLPETTVNWRLHQGRKVLKQTLLQREEANHE